MAANPYRTAFEAIKPGSYADSVESGAPEPAANNNPYEKAFTEIRNAPKPAGTLRQLGTQLGAGAVVDLPRMVGQAAQAFSTEGSPTTRLGKSLVAGAEQRAPNWEPDLSDKNEVQKALITGSRSIAPSLATVGAYAVPFAGPVLGPAATIGLYGGSQYQDTYEKAKLAGNTDEQAHLAGLGTGAIQGGGEALANKITLGLFGAGKNVAKAGIQGLTDTSVIKPFAKSLGVAAIGEPATEVGQDIGTALVERNQGIPTGPLSDIAYQSSTAALGMTALFAPFGLGGHANNARQVQNRNNVLTDTTKAPEERVNAANALHAQAKQLGIADADLWHSQAMDSISAGLPVSLSNPVIAQGPLTRAANSNPDSVAAAAAQIQSTNLAQAETDRVAQEQAAAKQADDANKQVIAEAKAKETAAKAEQIKAQQQKQPGADIGTPDTSGLRADNQSAVRRVTPARAPSSGLGTQATGINTPAPDLTGTATVSDASEDINLTPAQAALKQTEKQDVERQKNTTETTETLLKTEAPDNKGAEPFPATHIMSDGNKAIIQKDGSFNDINGDNWTDPYAEKIKPTTETKANVPAPANPKIAPIESEKSGAGKTASGIIQTSKEASAEPVGTDKGVVTGLTEDSYTKIDNENIRIDDENRWGKPKLKEHLDNGNLPIIDKRDEGGIRTYEAKGTGNPLPKWNVRLTLTPEEKKAAQRAEADYELAESAEEKQSAKDNLEKILLNASKRAVQETESLANQTEVKTSEQVKKEAPAQAVQTPSTTEGLDNARNLVAKIRESLARPGSAGMLTTPAELKKVATDLGVYSKAHKPIQVLEAVEAKLAEVQQPTQPVPKAEAQATVETPAAPQTQQEQMKAKLAQQRQSEPDVTQISKTHTKINSRAQVELINTGTGQSVFPGKTFKTPTEANQFFKAAKQTQLLAAGNTQPTEAKAEPVKSELQLNKTGKIESLADLISIALSRKDGNKAFSELGKVMPEIAKKVQQATGINVDGWSHGIDEAAIRHIIKEHGNALVESARGQIAVTPEDISNIKEIIQNPDTVEKGYPMPDGTETVIYKKIIDGQSIYVQEIREGREKLTAKTLWKVRTVPPATEKTGLVHTSETSSARPPQLDSSITQPSEKATNTKEDKPKTQPKSPSTKTEAHYFSHLRDNGFTASEIQEIQEAGKTRKDLTGWARGRFGYDRIKGVDFNALQPSKAEQTKTETPVKSEPVKAEQLVKAEQPVKVEAKPAQDKPVETDKKGTALYSKAQTPANGSTIQQVKGWLSGMKKLQGLIAAGQLRVVSNINQLPDSEAQGAGAEAIYNQRTNTITLFADNINDSNRESVLFHELMHMAEATDPKLKKALEQFEGDLQRRFDLALKGLGSKIENAAAARVIKADTPLADQQSEFRSYIISEYLKKPESFTGKLLKAIKDIFAAIRIALVRSGLDFGMVRKLSDADLYAMSKYGTQVKTNSVTAPQWIGQAALASSQASRFYSQLHRALITAPDKIFGNAAQVKLWLNSNAPKLGIKGDEIYWSGINDFLDIKAANKEKVTKADMDAFMRESGTVKVEDVMLGENTNKKPIKTIKSDGDVWTVEFNDGEIKEFSAYLADDKQEAEAYARKGKLDTKHGGGTLVIPGGRDYKELVITIPTIDKFNESDKTHFGDVSHGKAVAWVRMDTRTDANGKDTLFLQEVQSQRSQRGRKDGFSYLADKWQAEFQTGDVAYFNNEADAKKAEKQGAKVTRVTVPGVPPAPFVTDANNKATNAYIALTLKKAISHAVDNGQHSVSWTTGNQQSERYNLSKQINSVSYRGGDYQELTYNLIDNSGTKTLENVPENKIADYIGKEVAEKLLQQPVEFNGFKILKGLDLDIKPAWVSSMYGDENGMNKDGKPAMITQAAMEIARKMGGEVGSVSIPGQSDYQEILDMLNDFDSFPEGSKGRRELELKLPKTYDDRAKLSGKQPALIITDSMAAKIRAEGMPLFSKTGGLEASRENLPATLNINGKKRSTTNSNGAPIAQTEEAIRNFYAWFKDSKVVDDQGRPLVVYHGTNNDFNEFDVSNELGAHFGSTGQAGSFAKTKGLIIPAYIKMDNPLRLVDNGSFNANDIIGELIDTGVISQQAGENILRNDDPMATDLTKKLIKKSGFDGIVYLNRREGLVAILDEDEDFEVDATDNEFKGKYPNAKDSYIAFESNQIKSATGNSGAFSTTNNDIRFSVRAATENTEPHIPQVDTWLSKWLNHTNLDTAIYNLQDRYIDLYRQMQKITKEGGVITESENARMGEEVSHQRIQSRIKEFYDTQFNPILEELHDNKLDMDAFQKVLQARHAPSRNEVMAERNPNQEIIDEKLADAEQALEDAVSNKEKQQASTEIAKWSRAKPFRGTEEERLSLSGMTDEQAQTTLDNLTPEQKRVMLPLADKIDAINNDTLDLMVAYGMETPESIQALKDQWEHYVPLHRDEAHPDDANFGHPIGRGYSIRGTGIKTATGSNAEVTNIMAHIAAAREQMLRRGEKNKVTVQLADFITNHPDSTFAVTKPLPTKDYLVNGLVETLPDPTFKDKNNIVIYRLNGKDKALIFNEYVPENVRLAMSLKNMNGIELDKVESLIAKGTRWLASVNTQFNVVFGLMNVTRDVQGAMLNLTSTPLAGKQRAVFSKMGDSIKIIAGVERGWANTDPALKAMYERFNKAGGTTAYSQMFEGIKDRDHAIRNELKKLKEGKAMHMGRAVVKALSDFNTVMENSTRLSVFMTAVESGLSDMHAASLAKNITVNFNRKGAYTTKVGSLYAFFNASMQGSFRMAETLKGPAGKQILIGGVGLGAALTILGIAAMGADDWDKIPEFIKERSLIIPAPWNSSGYIAIPMPLGFHILPTLGRVLVESLIGSNRITNQHRFMNLIGATTGAFNPLGGSDISTLVMPTVLDPALALWRNKDWTNKTVYLEDFNSLDPTPGYLRTKNTASAPSKWAAEAANTLTGGTSYKPGLWSPTPDQLDYVMGQLTGGTGRELLKAQEAVASIGSDEELPTYKIPLIGRLYGTVTGDAEERTAYYENVKALNEENNEVQGLLKEENGRVKANEYLRNNPLARVYNRAHVYQKMIDKLKKRPGSEQRIMDLMKRQNTLVSQAQK